MSGAKSFCRMVALSSLMATGAWAAESLWLQVNNSNWTTIPSVEATDPPTDNEAADDFDVVGSIERVVITGYDCFQCSPPAVAGVYVRFYAFDSATGRPGELQTEYYLAGGDPAFLYDAEGPAVLDITLPTPFEATGPHFFSTQIVFDGGGFWGWWISNYQAPTGEALYFRDNMAGGTWGRFKDVLGDTVKADLAFELWGTDATPPPSGSDPCGAWEVLDTPTDPNSIVSTLEDVLAFAADDAWAVGDATIETAHLQYETFTQAMHWDGTSWTVVPTPSPTAFPGGTYCDLQTIAAVSPTDMYAAGIQVIQAPDGFVGGQILVIHWDGDEWTVMENTPQTVGGTGSHVQDMAIFAPDDIWFVGDLVDPSVAGTQVALAMHYDGSDFTIVETPFPGPGTPGFGLEAISGTGPDDIWAVGGGSDGDYLAGSYIVHWDGSSWTHVPGPAPGWFQRLYGVAAIAPDDIWVVGDYADESGYHSLLLHGDGESWTQIDQAAGSTSLLAYGPDNIYSAGGGIYHYDGTDWSLVEDFSEIIGPAVWSLASADTCELFAVGRQLILEDVANFSARVNAMAPNCAGDANGDGTVDPLDSGYVQARLGCNVGSGDAACDAADVNADFIVDPLDVGFVLARLGTCQP